VRTRVESASHHHNCSLSCCLGGGAGSSENVPLSLGDLSEGDIVVVRSRTHKFYNMGCQIPSIAFVMVCVLPIRYIGQMANT
jgi:hypothetical protein